MKYPIIDESGKIFKEVKFHFLESITAGAGAAIAGVGGALGGLIAGERGAHHAREDSAVSRRHDLFKMREQNTFNAEQANIDRGFQSGEAQLARTAAAQAATKSYERSSAAAEKLMAFQKMMSDTAVQRKMADLKAAGVNPMLAVSGTAAGAPMAQGSQAQAPSSSVGTAGSGSRASAGSGGASPLSGVGNIVSKGIQAAVTSAISAVTAKAKYDKDVSETESTQVETQLKVLKRTVEEFTVTGKVLAINQRHRLEELLKRTEADLVAHLRDTEQKTGKSMKAAADYVRGIIDNPPIIDPKTLENIDEYRRLHRQYLNLRKNVNKKMPKGKTGKPILIPGSDNKPRNRRKSPRPY